MSEVFWPDSDIMASMRKPEKYEFERQGIRFLGLILSTEGKEMDPQNVSAIWTGHLQQTRKENNDL